MGFDKLVETLAKEIYKEQKQGVLLSEEKILWILRSGLNPFPEKPQDTFLEKFGNANANR